MRHWLGMIGINRTFWWLMAPHIVKQFCQHHLESYARRGYCSLQVGHEVGGSVMVFGLPSGSFRNFGLMWFGALLA